MIWPVFKVAATDFRLMTTTLILGYVGVDSGGTAGFDLRPTAIEARLSLSGMRRLFVAIFVVSAWSVDAQVHDRTLERIAIALETPRSPVVGVAGDQSLRATERQILGTQTVEPLADAPKLGPFELVAPQLRGEFVRLVLPAGEYLSRGARSLAAANRRRQEAAARRRVEADLEAWRRSRRQEY